MPDVPQNHPDPAPSASDGVQGSAPILAEPRTDAGSRRHAAARPVGRVSDPRTWMAALGVLVALIVVAVGGDLAFSAGVIHQGVSIGGVAVGRLTPSEARAKLAAAFAASESHPVTVRSGSSTWKVLQSDIDAQLDTTESVQAAMAVGRSRSAWAMVTERFAATFAGLDVASHITASERLTVLLDKIAATVAVPSRDASVAVRPSGVSLVPAEAGRKLDAGATRAAILGAFLKPVRSAAAVVVPAQPEITDAGASAALTDARKLAAGPVTITYGKQSTNVDRTAVASWIRFERRDSSEATGSGTASVASRVVLVASLDATRVGSAIATLTHGSGTPARNASFVASGGKVTIVPSRTGHGPDLAELASDLASACLSGGPRTATVRLVETQPALTTEQAAAMGISDRISTFTTNYSSANPARVNNVHLLARAFDMKLVPPGATFSFNQTAGERTAAKGYQEAPAIVDGKLVPQLGGGVCQVGTTFFNAVFFSGLPVVERHNHSFFISHYPKGRDATVSWGGPDFKFKNDTGNWILIRTAYTSTSLTIALYGTDPGYTVQYTTSAFTDVVPFKTTETKDPKLAAGARIVDDQGVEGGRVTVVRTVYKGGVVVRTDTFVSRYSPKTQVVRVGTKTASTTTTGTPKPKP